MGNPAKGTNSHASVWSSRSPVKEPGHRAGARPPAGAGTSMASQTGGEGEPGHEVSGTPVREVSKVPERRWDFVHRGRCWAAVLPRCLAPSFLVSKGVAALSRAHPGCALHDATHVPALPRDPEKFAGDN